MIGISVMKEMMEIKIKISYQEIEKYMECKRLDFKFKEFTRQRFNSIEICYRVITNYISNL